MASTKVALEKTLGALVDFCDAFDNEDDDLLQAYQESRIFGQHSFDEIVADFATLKARYLELNDWVSPR